MALSKRQRQTFFISIFLAGTVALIVLVIYLMTGKQAYKLYQNDRVGISIKYPSNWKVIENPEGGAVVVFLSPKENALDAFFENVSIVVQDLPPGKAITLQEYSNKAVEQLTVTLKKTVEVVERSPATLDGRAAYRFVWKEMGAANNPLAVKMTHEWVIKNNRAYQVTFGALLSRHDKYLGIVNTMLSSFTIK
ncbi:MAG: hypothetical protein A2Z88_05770 [Omnitrophica WOR_2 bacterium GWA2_47_8]|nr:MAG: hypothetical protein A2Z88_05770 [Omnitrophica WOR_2 bacterium GWA2_47_8]